MLVPRNSVAPFSFSLMSLIVLACVPTWKRYILSLRIKYTLDRNYYSYFDSNNVYVQIFASFIMLMLENNRFND